MSRHRNVINPGGGPIDIPDVDAFLAMSDPDDPPYVDLGGDMIVPLAELIEAPESANGHEQGCPATWPDEPRGVRRACWCNLPEDYELPASDDDGGGIGNHA